MIGEFRRVGDILFLSGLVDASSGNMSARTKDGLWITKTGRSLFGLRMKDIVKIGFERDVRWNAASSEVELHVGIYKQVEEAKAIIHAHCPATVALSLNEKRIVPRDYEGRLFLKEVEIIDIPLNAWGSIASQIIPDYFKNSPNRIVVARAHGVFAYAETLFDACRIISALENSSKIILLAGQGG